MILAAALHLAGALRNADADVEAELRSDRRREDPDELADVDDDDEEPQSGCSR